MQLGNNSLINSLINSEQLLLASYCSCGDGNKRIKDIILAYKFLQSLRSYICNFMENQCQFFPKCTTN